MELKEFLEKQPIGVAMTFSLEAISRQDRERSGRRVVKTVVAGRIAGGGRYVIPNSWVILLPRIRLYCDVCGDKRNFNPVNSTYELIQPCLELGAGPHKRTLDSGQEFESGRHRDQFVHYKCGDCQQQHKKYSLAVEITKIELPDGESLRPEPVGDTKTIVHFIITKYGEIPKPIKKLNPKIKQIVGDHWELYRKGADDEAAGNGIGAFAYYRRVVEGSRERLVNAVCDAAEKLEVPEENIQKIRSTLGQREFSRAVEEIDDLFPNDLKFNGRNALATIYAPLSAGIHNKSDEECLALAASVRTLLDALGERLTEVIANEDRIQDALKQLQNVAAPTSTDS